MRYLGPVSEQQIVAHFLKSEIASERFGTEILALLDAAGRTRKIIDEPDLGNEEENTFRVKLLSDFRGYRERRGMFENFPADVSWQRYGLSRSEVARIKYIDYSYWNELSGSSRLAADAAKNIKAGLTVFGRSSERFVRYAETLKSGATFPELIVAGAGPESELVVLDGHLRLTAYFLAPECVPVELEVMAGFAPDMCRWMSPRGV